MDGTVLGELEWGGVGVWGWDWVGAMGHSPLLQ